MGDGEFLIIVKIPHFFSHSSNPDCLIVFSSFSVSYLHMILILIFPCSSHCRHLVVSASLLCSTLGTTEYQSLISHPCLPTMSKWSRKVSSYREIFEYFQIVKQSPSYTHTLCHNGDYCSLIVYIITLTIFTVSFKL